jgi:hypothetical protein
VRWLGLALAVLATPGGAETRSYRIATTRSHTHRAPVRLLLETACSRGGDPEAYLAGLRAFLRDYDPEGARYGPGQLFDSQETSRLFRGIP